MGECMVWWVEGWKGGLMGGSCEIIKNLINLDLIEIIQFCLNIYDLWPHPHLWTGVWVDGWMGWLIDGSGKITKNE